MTKPQRVSKSKPKEAPITPLQLPKGVKTVIVYGGSFDPPHEWHIQAWYLGCILFDPATTLTVYVPAAQSPLKSVGPLASSAHRIAMLKAGIRPIQANNATHCTFACLWTDEVDRAKWNQEHATTQPSYTIDTVRRLRKVIPKHVTIRLLIGSDQALAFHKWKDYRSLLRNAEPIVAMRDPTPTPREFLRQLDPNVWTLKERLTWAERIAPHPPLRLSSTQLRAAIRYQPLKAREWSDRTEHITLPVAQYIVKHRLYGVGTKYKPITAKSSRKR